MRYLVTLVEKAYNYKYRCYANDSRINKNDGVMVFVNKNLEQNTKVVGLE